MKKLIHLKKEEQQLMPLFDNAFIENKPIPFPDRFGTTAYSNLFYWAHLEAFETSAFPLHPHEGFEIMTFVLKGDVEHYDTATKVWTPLKEGDVQVIQAGSGVQHSEKVKKGGRLFQIWFDPDFSKSIIEDATYQDYKKEQFKTIELHGVKRLTYLKPNGIISSITPNIGIEKLTFEKGSYQEILDENYTYSCYILDGNIKIDNTFLTKDDFFVLNETKKITFYIQEKAEVFIIKSLTKIEYDRFINRY